MMMLCPACRKTFCVPAAVRGCVVWHRGCDGDPLEECDVEYGEPVIRAVVSCFIDEGRAEVRECAER
jgi:hypothetical protein